MPFRLQTAGDWLRYLQNDNRDRSWLLAYEDTLINLIRQGLSREVEYHETVDLLMQLFPYFVKVHAHIEAWSPLLMDALLPAQDLQDNALQLQVFRWMGEIFLKDGKHQSANRVFSIALERADAGHSKEVLVAVYAGLFKLQWFDVNHKAFQSLVHHASGIALTLHDPLLHIELYDSLALAFARLGDFSSALGYGQTAFVIAHYRADAAAVAHTAYTLAAVYRQFAHQSQLSTPLCLASEFLEIARASIAHTEYAWQYSLLAYEQAGIYHQLGDFEAAESWFKQALDEALRLNLPQYVVVARHGLGLSQGRLGRYEPARANLLAALDLWTNLKNHFEQANTHYALADLEYAAGNHAFARQHLLSASEIVNTLPDTPNTAFLRAQIEELLGAMLS